MKIFKKGKWYKTADGHEVEFIIPIEQDGMYNVFRENEFNDYAPFYTDEDGVTAYGDSIIIPED